MCVYECVRASMYAYVHVSVCMYVRKCVGALMSGASLRTCVCVCVDCWTVAVKMSTLSLIPDGILQDVWKCGGPAVYTKLHDLVVCCW